MKKLIITLLIFTMLSVSAETPAAMYLNSGTSFPHALTLSFKADDSLSVLPEAFILSGDCVTVSSAHLGYIIGSADPTQTLYSFTLIAAEPGESIIRFIYGEETVIYVSVDDALTLFALDITSYGAPDGIVTKVNDAEHTVTLSSESLGEVIATIAPADAMPVIGEHIHIYTNGIITNSLPPLVNALAWEAIPEPEQRD